MAITILSNQIRTGYIPFDNGGPVCLPVTLTAEISQDCFVERLEIINISGGAVTLQVYDRQAVPIPLIPIDYSLADEAVLYYTADVGRRMKGGIQWKASSATGVYGYIRGSVS